MRIKQYQACNKQAGKLRIGLSVTLAAVTAATLSLAVASADWKPEPNNFVDANLIRVGISDDDMTAWEYPKTQVTATGPFQILDKATGLPVLHGQAGEIITVTVDGAGFYLQSSSSAKAMVPAPIANMNVLAVPPHMKPASVMPVPGALVVEPLSEQDRIKITNITRRKEIPEYRGVLEIVRASSSPRKLSVVDVLSLEDYLKAVVPNELPMRYGLEAVKAQAVAARNYAVRPREKPWKTFDICDSQLCQVYFGSQTETPDSNLAIADTEGLVGLYKGEPILALFSSSHGGFAESYSNAFSDPLTKQYPAPVIPYLSGGPDKPLPVSLDLSTEAGARKFWTSHVQSFDVESPYYRWEKRWTRPELEAAINKGLLGVSKERSTKDFVKPLLQPGQSIGMLKSIDVLERGVSGKAMVIAIHGTHGTWTVKKEFLIRKVFSKSDRMLPSGNVVFTPQKNAQGQLIGMVANGGGFGHGVGMSQLGASWMHKHGFKFPQIVQHYYKGVSLGSLPVRVGEGNVNKPVLTRFEVHRPHGTLWLQDGAPSTQNSGSQDIVRVQLNGKALSLSPSGTQSGIAVDEYLRPGQLNTLVLFPDASQPNRPLKAWIELYPPHPSAGSVANR